MFFALSGFLVSASLFRTTTLFNFAMLRILRIFPALMVEIIVSALILGPIITDFPLRRYFTDPLFFSYLCNLFGYIHYYLPGVYFTHSSSGTVNNQLWTVPMEILGYSLLMVFAYIGLLKTPGRAFFTLCIGTVCVFFIDRHFHLRPVILWYLDGQILILSFLGGIFVYVARDRLPYSFFWFACATVLACYLLYVPKLIYLTGLPVGYLTVYIGLTSPPKIPVLMRGDYSYGLYLYSYPMQQAITWFLGDDNSALINLAIAFPATLLIAVTSWHFVEKPTLKLKRLFMDKPLIDPKLKDPPDGVMPPAGVH